MLTVKKYNKNGDLTATEELNAALFGGKVYEPILHQIVVSYQANQRQGTVATKTRAEVRGGGKRPWRQKGTGRARASSIRSPLWVGGGTSFGPQPKSWSKKVTDRMKRLALLSACRKKAKQKAFHVIDNFEFEKPSTKKMVYLLEKMKIRDKVLIIDNQRDELVIRSGRNIPGVTLAAAAETHPYEILYSDDLLFTGASFAEFSRRLEQAAGLETGSTGPKPGSTGRQAKG